MRQGWSVITLPLFAWTFYAASLRLWHMPRFYQAAARDQSLHTLEHMCFLASALVLRRTALLSARTSAMGAAADLFLLFTTGLQDGLLGALLTFAPRPLYASYPEFGHFLGVDPLADQRQAEAVMWIFGGFIDLGAALAGPARARSRFAAPARSTSSACAVGRDAGPDR